MMRVLAGDIGGTNSRLMLVETSSPDWQPLFEKSYPSAKYRSFYQVLNAFLTEYDISSVDAACLAVAGPVKSGTVSVTNLPWVISEAELRGLLHTGNVALINDFVAVGHGISMLDQSDTLLLQQGQAKGDKSPHHDAAVMGAGTGLGVAHLVWMDNDYKPLSSEAGHVGFAPENEQQCELLSWLHQQYSHVSLEMILSGVGLVRIYNFLHEVTGLQESPATVEAMHEIDPAKVISDQALLGDDDLSVKTLEMFIDIYGSAAGNVALHYYPIANLYIAGGIAAKISSRMTDGRFTEAFASKGLMSGVLKNISVELVTQEKVGLYGAVSYAGKIAL